MTSLVRWSDGMEPLGDAVVAMGVFDGVHLGHQALLAACVTEARRREALSVALTFDPDPEQVVFPEAAAPQLLSLDSRLRELARTGVDAVVVVEFTPQLGAMPAERFLDDVLGTAMCPLTIHVGEGFRFGVRAEGDLDTLYVWAAEHNADVSPHPLLVIDGSPVSSTRIRALVAEGRVAEAAGLLGRPPAVTGTVGHGRGEGAHIGFATANVHPEPHAALPADGVYAGRAVLGDGTAWPAAISVGTPPSFPSATDFLEAHLIGFEGDLYEDSLTLEFVERLREQCAFDDMSLLSAQIAHDIARTVELSGGVSLPTDQPPVFDEDGVDDPVALAAAEEAVRHASRPFVPADADIRGWVCVFGPHRMSTLFMDGGVAGSLITGPLEAVGIAYAWDPFSPENAQNARPDFNWMREFRLLVAPDDAAQARDILRSFL